MMQRLTLSARLVGVAMLLGAPLLVGCGYNPDFKPRAAAQLPRPASPPGSFVIHMNGEVSSSGALSR